MPELPEVEVSRMGITPHLHNQTIQSLIFRTPKLRWVIPSELKKVARASNSSHWPPG